MDPWWEQLRPVGVTVISVLVIVHALAATVWCVAGAVLGNNADAAAEASNQLIGLIGLLVLAAVTAVEAGLAVKRVRQAS